ncbi:MAG: tetratricopeptide repeat protein [Opitutus sp.]
MPSRRETVVASGLIVLAALAAYSNSWGGPFVFDDVASILSNASIRHVWPLSTSLNPPDGFGSTVSGRPLLNLTLAVNYAISGEAVWSYHALNLIIHVAAGLVLFGLVRRTLCRPVFSERVRQEATAIAGVVALLWTVHPLQTEAVTYVIQRAESLMGLFYLLTLYGFARSIDATRQRTWQVIAVGCCALGMACKEVMVTAPVIVLLYDATFGAGSLRAALIRHRWLYLGFAASWGLLLVLVARTGGNRGGTFEFTPAALVDFALTQPEAICRYLRLVVWPAPLVFEYGRWKVENLWGVLPYALFIAVLIGLVARVGRRRSVVGFLGATFFVVLAPTSVMPGVTQIMAEHRMYLPLAAVVALLVGAGFSRWGRKALAVGLTLALVASGLTYRRNQDYRSAFALWSDTVRKRPGSAMAQSNLGSVYFERGDMAAAHSHYLQALRLDPNSAHAHYNLGLTLDAEGRREEAIPEYREALRILPYYAQASVKMGAALIQLGRPAEAVEPLVDATRRLIDPTDAYLTLGAARLELGDSAGAKEAYDAALLRSPSNATAELGLASVLFKAGEVREAIARAERSLVLAPGSPDAHRNLALMYASVGETERAIGHDRAALRQNPNLADVRLNLGISLAQLGQAADAEQELRIAARLNPGSPEAHANLANVLAETNQLREALEHYDVALRLRPDYAIAHYNVANALLRMERWAEAKAHLVDAVRLRPDLTAARETLERLNSISPAR